MKSVQRIFLKFLEIDEDDQNLISLLQDEKIQEEDKGDNIGVNLDNEKSNSNVGRHGET